MGRKNNRDRQEAQRRVREQRAERAFLFDKDLARCLGEADRERWETAISFHGGDVAAAAKDCGLGDLPRSARVLWGRSAEEALGIYRRWQKKRGKA
jgi:hypothetical protein